MNSLLPRLCSAAALRRSEPLSRQLAVRALPPQIKDLRTLRVKFQEQESEYLEKKQRHDNTKAGLDTETAKLQAECDAAENEVAE